MRNLIERNRQLRSGFTIVELIVVISVIAILAVITILSYGAWQKSVRGAAVKNDLNAASATLESARNFSTGYPLSIPVSYVESEGVHVEPTLLTAEAYCLDGQSTQDATVQYYIYSKAKDGGPQEGTCETRPSLELPTVPTGLVIVSTTGTTASLSWPSVADVTSYTAQCASDIAFIYAPQQGTTPQVSGTVTLTITGLTPASTFYCRVKSTNNKGSSAWSAVMSSQTSPTAAPAGLAITMGSSSTSINYSWSAVSGAASYNIQRAKDSDFTQSVVTVNQTSTSGTSTGLSQNTAYYYRVQAVMPPVASAYSTVVSQATCPSGFIGVPGNSAFGTSNFCVMKYEAKLDSGTTPVSQAGGTPWASISQATAATYSSNVAGCPDCHLITEAEWMTIAANIISVGSNWSGGSVGSGYVYQGHINNNPAAPLAASTDDSDGLNGISGGTGGSGLNSRRTLTLSNGEVIWDLSGNVYEWTTGTIAGSQQAGLSGEVAYAWKQWNNASLLWRSLPLLSRPGGISATVGGYSSTQGIGQLYSNYGDATARVFLRGGSWGSVTNAGVLTLATSYASSFTSTDMGFRVTR